MSYHGGNLILRILFDTLRSIKPLQIIIYLENYLYCKQGFIGWKLVNSMCNVLDWKKRGPGGTYSISYLFHCSFRHHLGLLYHKYSSFWKFNVKIWLIFLWYLSKNILWEKFLQKTSPLQFQ